MSYQITALTMMAEQFERLPGVGKKSAQRLAFFMLSLSDDDAAGFTDAIHESRSKAKRCKICQGLCDDEICPVCADEERDRSVICVVEQPQDMMAVERTNEFKGVYHVLHGAISPIVGSGPDGLTLSKLLKRVEDGDVREIILATNPTVEGEATSMYISRVMKPRGIRVTRLAYGIPVGGDLEYADEVTLTRAMEGRHELD